MHFRFLALLFIIVLALSACATAKEKYLSEGYRLLSADEIRALHLDKTHEFKLASGKTALDFFTADGRSSFQRSDGVADQGRWEIQDQHVCYVYPSIPATSENCFSMAAKDGRYVLFKEFPNKKGEFGAEVISITPGNAKNLPLE
jgi:hypothetical protein